MNQVKTLGVFGGTFDPIHYGHLRIAAEMAETLDIQRVHFIPSSQPVHRDPALASAHDRFEMVKLATASNPHFFADNREIKRGTPSYTIDTLLELREEFPETSLCLFLGFDAFLGFHTWERYQEILELAHLVIARRPNLITPSEGVIHDLMSTRTHKNNDYIQTHRSGGLFFLPTIELDIAAKDIRKQIALKRNPRYLLPDDVLNYIQQNGIYEQ